MPEHRRRRLHILTPIVTIGALAVAPSVANAEDVEIHEGDTLWNLTTAQYGDISYDHVLAVAAVNDIGDPNLIYAGDVLSMPDHLRPLVAARAAGVAGSTGSAS